jgi:hypothetical protein
MKELSLHILDIVQNSIRANASEITISVSENIQRNEIIIGIKDNGNGIPKEMLASINDPFTTSRKTRKVGMGLSLLRHHAELAGGYLKISSNPGKGTRIKAVFVKNHINLQPMGDIAGVVKLLLAANPGIEFKYKHSTCKGNFSFSSAEARKTLEIENFNNFYLLEQLKGLINENLAEIDAIS